MFSKEKKTYDAPDIEKIPLADDALDKVTGGTQPDGTTDGGDLSPEPDSEENSIDKPSMGDTDVGQGRGRGGGCDGVAYHHPARTFSSGRNRKC